VSACRSCGAPVEWGVSVVSGKRMPLDAEPDPEGLFYLERGDVTTVGPMDPTLYPNRKRYTSHFATCPDAEDWRKGKQ